MARSTQPAGSHPCTDKPPRGKFSHHDVDYTAHGFYKEHCSICTHYIDPDACEGVKSPISPKGWCCRFTKENSHG